MQSSWFPKPVYKIIKTITILSLTGCVWLIVFSFPLWPLLLGIFIISILTLAVTSFIVCSGVYVTTTCKGGIGNNKIAITFDDGPCKQTKEILSMLDRYNAKATFFLIGSQAEIYRDIVSDIVKNHHTIGNHSFNHDNWFPLKGTRRITKELSDTQTILSEITGSKPVYFRPPFGVTNPSIAKALKSFNLKTIGWSVRSLDTVKKNPEKIFDRVKSKIGPGSIVLMHDTSQYAPLVLEQLLIYCMQKKLSTVSLDELLKEN
jgi:peptidoglycan/xylan/chitin deacetylase (PgdA/CDA1 family)